MARVRVSAPSRWGAVRSAVNVFCPAHEGWTDVAMQVQADRDQRIGADDRAHRGDEIALTIARRPSTTIAPWRSR